MTITRFGLKNLCELEIILVFSSHFLFIKLINFNYMKIYNYIINKHLHFVYFFGINHYRQLSSPIQCILIEFKP